MYHAGKGEKQNYEEAAKWYRKAAEQGYSKAQCQLGSKYASGKGVEKDFEEAAKWFRLAAERGSAEAQLYLGALYYQAQGVKKDNITAYVWWKISADKGNEKAKAGKVLVSKDMTPDQIAKAEALAKEMLAKNPKLIKKKE